MHTSAMDPGNDLVLDEERLREASCTGDEDTVLSLIREGVDVNNQHRLNGWTALHWAAKRNHANIARYLIQSGADKTLKTVKGESAIQLTESATLQSLLGAGDSNQTNGVNVVAEKTELPFTPNYLKNPPFPHINNQSNKMQMHAAELPASLSGRQGDSRQHGSSSAITANNNLLSVNHTDEDNELVLKIRIANAAETDFLEIELDKRKLSFENLLMVMCKELQVQRDLVTKIRKLPDTIVRKDKDVRRLKDFQEMELVLSNKALSEASRNYTSAVSPRNVNVVY